MPFKFSVLAKRQVFADVLVLVNDQPLDVIGDQAALAFMPTGTLPAATDFKTARWSSTLIDGAPAQVIALTVGPNDGNPPAVDITLAPGSYDVWAKVVTADEMFTDQVDTITVTGANDRVPIVSVAEMADYMGYPFKPEQVQAVADVISGIQGEVEDYLRADLTNKQWTETYVVPYDGPTPFATPYIGMDYQNLYPDTQLSGLGGTWAGQVILKHWPVTDWVSLAVNQATTLAQTGLTATVPLTPGVATVTDSNTGATGAITAINGQVGTVPAATIINSLSIRGLTGSFDVGDPIVIHDAGNLTAGIIAVGGVTAGSTAQVTVGTGTFSPKAPVFIPIVAPIYPESLPLFAPGTQVQVTYRAGWDGPNIDTIKAVIRRTVARELTNRLDDAVGLRGMSVVRIPDPGQQGALTPGLSDADKKRISRYKHYMIL